MSQRQTVLSPLVQVKSHRDADTRHTRSPTCTLGMQRCMCVWLCWSLLPPVTTPTQRLCCVLRNLALIRGLWFVISVLSRGSSTSSVPSVRSDPPFRGPHSPVCVPSGFYPQSFGQVGTDRPLFSSVKQASVIEDAADATLKETGRPRGP